MVYYIWAGVRLTGKLLKLLLTCFSETEHKHAYNTVDMHTPGQDRTGNLQRVKLTS